MKIKKMYQGTAPENKILNTQSNSQTDVYSCDYVNKLNTYSTDEHIIGTWITGKPVYRKVIDIDYITLNEGVNTIEHGISNMEAVVRMDFMLRYTNENWYYNWDMYRNITIGYSVITVNISSDAGTTHFNDGHIILEYTKTTD